MFNLKKMSQKAFSIFNTQLKDQRDKHGVESVEDSGNYQYRLEEDRTGSAEDKNVTYQKLLDDARSENDGQEITEAAHERTTSGKFNLMKHRTEGKPIMDYWKESSMGKGLENEKDFEKESESQKRDTEFWDKYVEDQLIGPCTTIVKNEAPSQLLSKYKSREEFEKQTIHKKAAIERLKDADAMLYYIYRKASEQNREVNETESQMINDINSGKIRILSQSFNEIDDGFKNDQSDIVGDDLESLKNTNSYEEDEQASYLDLANVVVNDRKMLAQMGKEGLNNKDWEENTYKFFNFIIRHLDEIKLIGNLENVKNPEDLEVDWYYESKKA